MPEPAACLNCDEPFGERRPRYCPACGQETNVKPPTLREFAQQFGGNYIAVEGALWRSLKLLLFKPGQLTREYLEGRRRRYVLPLRLYITVSVVALLVLRLNAHVDIKTDAGGKLHSVTTEEMVRELHDFTVVDMGSHRAGLKGGVFFCEQLPGWLCDRLQRRLDLEPKAFAAEAAALPERVVERFGSAMFLMVPLFAVGMKLLYLNRRMRYTEHLVYALHLHAFWLVALALSTVTPQPLSGIAIFAVPVYGFLAERRVYRPRWWAALLRESVLAFAYSVALMAAMIFVAMWVFLS